jgi:hypothetical protein
VEELKKLLGLIAVAALGAAVVASLPDIKRYVEMRKM